LQQFLRDMDLRRGNGAILTTSASSLSGLVKVVPADQGEAVADGDCETYASIGVRSLLCSPCIRLVLEQGQGWLDPAKSPSNGESGQPEDTGNGLILRLILSGTAGGPSGLHSNKSE
jgi:hypothetical protein